MCSSPSIPSAAVQDPIKNPDYATYGEKAAKNTEYNQAVAKGTNSTDLTGGLISPLGMNNNMIRQAQLLGIS